MSLVGKRSTLRYAWNPDVFTWYIQRCLLKRSTALLTNDDGIQAPDLRCLVETLVNGGRWNLNVCAPDQIWSKPFCYISWESCCNYSWRQESYCLWSFCTYSGIVPGAGQALLNGVLSLVNLSNIKWVPLGVDPSYRFGSTLHTSRSFHAPFHKALNSQIPKLITRGRHRIHCEGMDG